MTSRGSARSPSRGLPRFRPPSGRRSLARLHMDCRRPEGPLTHPTVARLVEAVDCYRLPTIDLGRYAGLLIPPLVDQEWLYRHRGVLRSYLDAGGTVVFSGHLHRPWLPGAGLFVPKPVTCVADYAVEVAADHPVFAGVTGRDLTFRRGVAGFFARGHHPPPAGARPLVTFASGEPVVYLDRVTTGGTLLVHAGNDLLGWVDGENTARRLVPQLLTWMCRTGTRGVRPAARNRAPEVPDRATDVPDRATDLPDRHAGGRR